MPLFAYNITGAPVPLAAGTPVVTLPGCVAPPARGPAYNVTSELRPDLAVDPVNGKAGGVGFGGFTALQVQITANQIELEWTSDAEYLTPGLVIGGPAPGPHALVGVLHTASGLTTGHVVRATGPTTFGWGLVPTPVYNDSTRPAANTVPAGTQIFNTDEGANGAPNWSNGTSWVDAVGNLT